MMRIRQCQNMKMMEDVKATKRIIINDDFSALDSFASMMTYGPVCAA